MKATTAFLRQRCNSCGPRLGPFSEEQQRRQATQPLLVRGVEDDGLLSRSVTEGQQNQPGGTQRKFMWGRQTERCKPRRFSGNGVASSTTTPSLLSAGDGSYTEPQSKSNPENGSTRGGRQPPSLAAEIEEGNTEYKLQLTDADQARIKHLATQMKWRLYEGGNEAYYWIGVEDDGTMKGITEEQMNISLKVIYDIAKSLEAEVSELLHLQIQGRHAKKLLVRCSFKSSGVLPELQVALLGQSASGKSTLSGVLTNAQLDNGEGLARLFVLRHGHELEEGHTSSISPQYLGVSSQGSLVRFGDNGDIGYDLTANELLEKSSKVLTLLDLAGDLRYLKTIILGLMGYLPEYCLLLVDAQSGLSSTFKQYLGVALALKLRVVIIVNKIDLVTAAAAAKVDEHLDSLLSSAGMSISFVKNENDALEATKMLKFSEDVVPCFHLSCVSGEGIPLLKTCLCSFRQIRDNDAFSSRETIVRLSEAFYVDDVGIVLVGTVFSGKVHVGDYVKLGPNGLGEFHVVKIRSIHVLRVPVDTVLAGHAATFAIQPPKGTDCDKLLRSVRRGMVLVDHTSYVRGSQCAELDILVLKHVKPLSLRQRPMLYSGNVRQLVNILHSDCAPLSTGDRATIQVKFEHHPEFILVGMPVLLVLGHSHFLAVGTVTDSYAASDKKNFPVQKEGGRAGGSSKERSYSEHSKELVLARASPVLSPAKPVDAESSSVRRALSSLSLTDER